MGAWLARTPWRTGPLLAPVDRWGNVARRHLTTKAIADAVNTARDAAGLPRLTAHDFRRMCIGDLLDSGADLATAQALVGHASPITTARYDRRPAATRRAAVARLHIPGPRIWNRTSASPRPYVRKQLPIHEEPSIKLAGHGPDGRERLVTALDITERAMKRGHRRPLDCPPLPSKYRVDLQPMPGCRTFRPSAGHLADVAGRP